MKNHDLLLGPILGYEWDDQTQQAFYTVIVRATHGAAPVWIVDKQQVPMQPLRTLHDNSGIWRGEIALNPFDNSLEQGRTVSYHIEREQMALSNLCNASKWEFHLPGKLTPDQQPRIAFCSCNGFTDSKALSGREPLHLWQRMQELHTSAPFSLLIMGGDQLYCDELASQTGGFAKLWTWLKAEKRDHHTKPTPEQFLEKYFDHYLDCWVRYIHGEQTFAYTPMMHMMASVPSIMIWDDHDIFDGWGSYEAKPKNMPYHIEAFTAARAAFEVYQIRGASHNRALLDRKNEISPNHYSQGLKFGPFHILALDNRSHRTPSQVMNTEQWHQVIDWLKKMAADASTHNTLLVISPVPLVYRRFQDWISELPGEHAGEDDLRDHWNHKNHESERNKLVNQLFNALRFDPAGTDYMNQDKRADMGFGRVTLLSGDVHVGALGFLERTDTQAEIAQIISSGIIHPEPGPVAWAGVCAISSDAEYHIHGQSVKAKMTRPVGVGAGNDKYLRCRNFVWFKPGNDGRLWVNWECEDIKQGHTQRKEFGLR